jgi:hypothetical protein
MSEPEGNVAPCVLYACHRLSHIPRTAPVSPKRRTAPAPPDRKLSKAERRIQQQLEKAQAAEAKALADLERLHAQEEAKLRKAEAKAEGKKARRKAPKPQVAAKPKPGSDKNTGVDTAEAYETVDLSAADK